MRPLMEKSIMPDNDNTTKASLRTLRCNASNIQALLRMASDGDSTFKILEKITPIIRSHFERVENLDINIPDENLRDHKSLLRDFKLMEADWGKKRLSDADYIEALRFKLFNHFTMFFEPLLDTELEEDSPLKFRL